MGSSGNAEYMGITSNFNLELDTSDPITTMKLFLLAIALATVSAEPESKSYYGGVLGGYGYGGYGHYLVKRSAEADSYYGGVLGGYGYGGYGHYLGKRSADSYYGGVLGGYGYGGYVYGK